MDPSSLALPGILSVETLQGARLRLTVQHLQHSRTEVVTHHLCSVTTDLSSLPKNSSAKQLPLRGRGMARSALQGHRVPAHPEGPQAPHPQGGPWGRPCWPQRRGCVTPCWSSWWGKGRKVKPCQTRAEFCFCFAGAACGEENLPFPAKPNTDL